jgi:hypothetical protein
MMLCTQKRYLRITKQACHVFNKLMFLKLTDSITGCEMMTAMTMIMLTHVYAYVIEEDKKRTILIQLHMKINTKMYYPVTLRLCATFLNAIHSTMQVG